MYSALRLSIGLVHILRLTVVIGACGADIIESRMQVEHDDSRSVSSKLERVGTERNENASSKLDPLLGGGGF